MTATMEAAIGEFEDDLYEIVIMFRGKKRFAMDFTESLEAAADSWVMKNGGELIGVYNTTTMKREENE